MRIITIPSNLAIASPLPFDLPSSISSSLPSSENPNSPISSTHPTITYDQIRAFVISHEPIISPGNEFVIMSKPLSPYFNLAPSPTNDLQLIVDLPI